MIGSLKGIVAGLAEDRALIEVQGVGYLVYAGGGTLGRLAEGKPVHLHIETQLREDSLKLFGFLSDADRAWFVRLQDIPGVGAKVALAILDILGPDGLLEAVAMQDKASVARANGVGPKLAARIVQELEGKVAPRGFTANSAFTGPSSSAATTDDQRREGLKDMTLRNEAVSALVNLGYPQPDALRAVIAAYRTFVDDPAVGVLVKAALKELGK